MEERILPLWRLREVSPAAGEGTKTDCHGGDTEEIFRILRGASEIANSQGPPPRRG